MLKKISYNLKYIGNGATAFLSDEKKGKQITGGTGRLRFCVEDKSVFSNYVLRECFMQKQAQFAGYYLRRKKGKNWQWYCTDNKWHGLNAIVENEVFEQMCLPAGRELDFSGLKVKRGQTVFLDAQWRNDETQEEMNCGWWVFRNQLMCHALGVSDSGKCYQNTEAVFKESYRKGYRYFEADVALTADDRLVCCHGWSKKNCEVCGMEWRPEFEQMSYDLFMKQKVDGNPVMDATGLCRIMKEYPDTYFEIDLHKGNYGKKIELLLEAMEHTPELLDRLLIQAQGRVAFKEINETHRFLNVQIIAGQEWLDKMEGMIAFALENGICAIALRKDLAQEKQVQMIRKAGLYVLAYTIAKDVKLSKDLLGRGVSTICTDKVTYEALESVE